MRAPGWSAVIGRGEKLRRQRDVAAAEWARVTEELRASGLLAEVDRAAVQSYCVGVAQEDDLVRLIAREGWTSTSERGTVRHHAVPVLNQIRAHNRATRAELGLGPKARAALGRVAGSSRGEPVPVPVELEEELEDEPVEVPEDDGVVVRGRWNT